MTRYNRDGSLDATFSGDGRQTTDFGARDAGSSIAIQPDGRIVVAGQVDSVESRCRYNFALARYNRDGSLDRTFSEDGKQITQIGDVPPGEQGDEGPFFCDGLPELAIQPDGRIVVAGTAYQDEDGAGGYNLAVARYLDNGTLDPTFSADGKQTTDFSNQPDYGRGVAIQPDGRIVVAGDDFKLARYLPDGSLDPTFSQDGKQTTDFGSPERRTGEVGGVALQPDGKIVVVGRISYHVPDDDGADTCTPGPCFDEAGRSGAIARYNQDGSLDPTFSQDGWTPTGSPEPDAELAEDVAVQPDGRIVVTGYVDSIPTGPENASDESFFGVGRFHPNGAPDLPFSEDGKQATDFGEGGEGAQAVALQPDGKILVAGGFGPFCCSGDDDFAVARYLARGGAQTKPPPPSCTIRGTSGNDIIRATRGNDVICAGDGNDIVYGGGGNDTLRGGSGNDIIRGGEGDARISGGSGNDILYGDGGSDRLHGEEGRDVHKARDEVPGNDVADGGPGDDSCDTDPGDARASC